jgi:hypothetical protein
MFLFGNENNYGLSWGGGNTIGELDNVSGEERKARALYSLFEEAMRGGKALDNNHPFGFVNGDVGFLDVIASECPSLDVLGVNVYRGKESGEGLYTNVKAMLDRPLVYTEIGADAWNALENREDQYNQALIIASQWKEIYSQAYGKGNGNTLGGFVFEWADEWWKHLPDSQERLNIHDTDADWENGGYPHDYVPGRPNMNEEWLGITAHGKVSAGKFPLKLPRTAFYALQHIWRLDPLEADQDRVDAHFGAMSLGALNARGMEGARENRSGFTVTNEVSLLWNQGGNDVQKNFDIDTPFAAFSRADWGIGLRTTFAGVGYEALTGKLDGAVTVQLRHDTLYGSPVSSLVEQTDEELNPDRGIDVYSAYVNWTGRDTKVKAFYHVGHNDWADEGDFFSFLPESYDVDQYYRWGNSTPVGVEVIKNFGLPGNYGLKVLAGPEPYSGARPQVIGKWFQPLGAFNLALLHAQETAI